MSGVGSTNAMKKGSANNPFLAYSEADMQGFLNSAYTGCIVKYAGPSTKTAVPRGNGLNLGDAQNLVVDLTKSFTYNQGSSKSRKWYITIESETGNKCIMDITINKQTGVIGTPTLISDTIKALIYSIYTPYSSIIGRNINDLDVKFLSVTGTDVDRDVVTNWPITYGKNGWQSDCFNDSGKITLWGYGEKVTAIQNQNDMDYWSAYPILYTEPYVANVLYKVVYSNGQYYFEEFYHISENITTATVEDVAPGKTFYDFTGTKQTGTGTKINPYLASTADEMAAYLTSSYKGAFVKYIGETVSAGGTTVPVNPINIGDTITKLYFDTTKTPDFSKFDWNNPDNDNRDYLMKFFYLISFRDDLDSNAVEPKHICAIQSYAQSEPFYYLGVFNTPLFYTKSGWKNLEEGKYVLTTGNPVVALNHQDIWGEYISKDGQWTSNGGESYVKNAIYQVAEDGDTTRYMILPTLSNPGTAADLAQGKQLIDGDGKIVEGTAGFSSGDYTVKVIDYDGTVLMEKKGNTGDVIDLPTAPTHEKLVFQEWSASVAVSDNKVTIADNNIMVGAVYTTSSGQNEFDITLTKVTGLSVTLNMNGTKDWGDGTSDTAKTHTYTAYGNYTIKCNGMNMTTGSDTGLFGQSSGVKNYYCTKVRFATVTNINKSSIQNCYSLTSVVISNSVTNIANYVFRGCYSLENVVIPNGVEIINEGVFNGCYSLINVVIPNSVTNIADYAFYQCYSLASVVISNSVTNISNNAFNNCYTLTNFVIPNSVTHIYNSALSYCYSLTSICIPSSVNGIDNYVFYNCYSITKYDFSQHTSVPTLSGTNAFTGINKIAKIIVPDNIYDAWIAAPNWSDYADYICKASEEVTQ